MDPLSIAAACASLAVTIGKTSYQVATFVRTVRDARSDMDAISRELVSLKTALDILADDTKKPGVKIPDSLDGILSNCSDIMGQLVTALKGYEGERLTARVKWTWRGKDEMDKYRILIAAHKGSLDLAIDLTTLSITRDIKNDTEQIRDDTADIKNNTEQILAEIAKLQARLPQSEVHGVMLQKYLDNMTSYAGTAYAGSVQESDPDLEDVIEESVSDQEEVPGDQAAELHALQGKRTSLTSQIEPFGLGNEGHAQGNTAMDMERGEAQYGEQLIDFFDLQSDSTASDISAMPLRERRKVGEDLLSINRWFDHNYEGNQTPPMLVHQEVPGHNATSGIITTSQPQTPPTIDATGRQNASGSSYNSKRRSGVESGKISELHTDSSFTPERAKETITAEGTRPRSRTHSEVEASEKLRKIKPKSPQPFVYESRPLKAARPLASKKERIAQYTEPQQVENSPVITDGKMWADLRREGNVIADKPSLPKGCYWTAKGEIRVPLHLRLQLSNYMREVTEWKDFINTPWVLDVIPIQHTKPFSRKVEESCFYPVHQAIILDDMPWLDMLLRFGADLTVRQGKTDRRDFLLREDAKVTPLLQAVCQLNLQATRRLLDAGAKIEQEKYLIFLAVSVGGETTSQVAMVKLLIQNGADVNEGLLPSYGTSTPLEHTIHNCDFTLTRLLLENGANADIGLPLHRAVRSKNPASVRALMEYGANPNRGTNFYAHYLRNKASPMRLVGKEYVFEMRYVTAIKLAKQMKDSSKEIVEILENTLPLHRNATGA